MELTQDEARALMSRLLSGQELTMYPFDAGWLARPVLSDEQTKAGQGLGLGSYVVDRTGVVTAHSSLPITMIMEQYAAARRTGRITGRQVWPPELTDEEAGTLAERLSAGREVTMRPFAFGWVTTTEDGESLIVDRTGVATVHSGRSPKETVDAYVAARREGSIPGRRVWPPTASTALFGSDQEMTPLPVEFGWVTSREPTEEEIRTGRTDPTTFVLDRTGVVTVHPGRPIAAVTQEYATERRKGRITGRQIWPPTAT
jgi:hypothetical protein